MEDYIFSEKSDVVIVKTLRFILQNTIGVILVVNFLVLIDFTMCDKLELIL